LPEIITEAVWRHVGLIIGKGGQELLQAAMRIIGDTHQTVSATYLV